MLPLAGGPEVANLDMDDMDKLPDDLQFLEETKQREVFFTKIYIF